MIIAIESIKNYEENGESVSTCTKNDGQPFSYAIDYLFKVIRLKSGGEGEKSSNNGRQVPLRDWCPVVVFHCFFLFVLFCF